MIQKLNFSSLRFAALICIMSVLSVTTAFGQTQTVSGVVSDADGPVIGAGVSEKGNSGNGTATNADGKYMLTVSSNATLVISYLGYLTQEIAVNGKTTIDVFLKENATELDEVVVVGFGTQKKVNLTGAIGIATAKDIADRPVVSVTQALQGLVPGMTISQNSGSLDATATIRVRGKGTLDSANKSDPLVLIDGAEGDINAINPADIETMSILKDAAASSIYGAKASFGVILITTKSGKAGKTRVNYSNNFRYNSPVLMPTPMDSYTLALYFNEALANGGEAPHFNESWVQAIKDYQDGVITSPIYENGNTGQWEEGFDPTSTVPGYSKKIGGIDNRNYYKEIYRSTAASQEHNLSISGGNDKLTFFGSLNYLDQNGLMVFNQDQYDRFSTNVRVSYQLYDWAKLGYSNRFVRNTYERPAALTNSLYTDIGRHAWAMLPMYDPNGNLFQRHALNLRDSGNDRATTDNSYQQATLTLEPIKNWRTNVEVNYSIKNYNRHWDKFVTYRYDMNNSPMAWSKSSNVHEEELKDDLLGINAYSEYSFSLNQKHNFKAMIGMQEQAMSQVKFGLQRAGVMDPNLPEIDLTDGYDENGKSVVPSVNGEHNRWTTLGYFGRINYDFNGKYLLEANLRYDGSSRYRAGHRGVWSPSFSLGWNIAQENFMESINEYVGLFKLRASYGQLANQNTNNWYPSYSNLGLYPGSGAWLQGGLRPNITTSPGTVENPFLTWESAQTINGGIDIAVLKNRLTASIDFYQRTTINMFGPAPDLPKVLGVDPKKANDTELQDRGFELSVAWNDRLANGLNYGARVVLSDYTTKVTKYPSNPTGTLNSYNQGQILGQIWGYQTIGIAKTKEEMDAHLATLPNGGQSALNANWGAGDIMYADLNGDGKIDNGAKTLGDHGDLKVIGNTTPRYQFGIDLTADWKGIDVRAFFQGVMKRDYWQGSYLFWGARAGGNDGSNNGGGNGTSWQDGGIWWATGFTSHLDYFRDENSPLGANTDSYFPKPYLNNAKNNYVQSRYLQDASYIRLKNLQIGYTLPASLTNKVKVEKLRIFFSGENLWTGTKMAKTFDPETIDGGWNGSVYPLSKVLSFGVNLNF
ncbi:SusC/RagA family TonB-linked outer membrane protein [Bacteroidia bacterium]|nr:SusC/RagA family TonB-linked outer membrane protein [Bacteroidia bacterium]GHV70265.1 SusC/RagA family TonB-linked outer membrane protein [Bacteroidia bacterium]